LQLANANLEGVSGSQQVLDRDLANLLLAVASYLERLYICPALILIDIKKRSQVLKVYF